MNSYIFHHGKGGKRMLKIDADSFPEAWEKARRIYAMAGWRHKPHIRQVTK